MNGHLSDEQWAAAVLDPAGGTVAEHLRECADCREEMSSFERPISKVRAEIHRASERPESFWIKQRHAICARAAQHRFPPPWKRLAWCAATVVLVLLSTTVLSRRNAPPLRTETVDADPDDALLLSVQQSIRSDLPQALRPAALLAQEINQATVVRGQSPSAHPQGELP